LINQESKYVKLNKGRVILKEQLDKRIKQAGQREPVEYQEVNDIDIDILNTMLEFGGMN
jgi:hypothetical protein